MGRAIQKSEWLTQQGERLFWVSVEATHGLATVGDMQAVKEGEDGAVEYRQDEHGGFGGELQAVFT